MEVSLWNLRAFVSQRGTPAETRVYQGYKTKSGAAGVFRKVTTQMYDEADGSVGLLLDNQRSTVTKRLTGSCAPCLETAGWINGLASMARILRVRRTSGTSARFWRTEQDKRRWQQQFPPITARRFLGCCPGADQARHPPGPSLATALRALHCRKGRRCDRRFSDFRCRSAWIRRIALKMQHLAIR